MGLGGWWSGVRDAWRRPQAAESRAASGPPVVAPGPTASRSASPEAWAVLPPVQRALAEPLAPAAPLDVFAEGLASYQNPSFLGPLTHAVDPRAGGGLVQGLADLAPGSPRVYRGGDDLSVRTLPPRGRTVTAQRSTADWTGPAGGSGDSASEALDIVRWEHPSAGPDLPVPQALELSGSGSPEAPLSLLPARNSNRPAPPRQGEAPTIQRQADQPTGSQSHHEAVEPPAESADVPVATVEDSVQRLSPALVREPGSGSVDAMPSAVHGSPPQADPQALATPELAPLIVARTVSADVSRGQLRRIADGSNASEPPTRRSESAPMPELPVRELPVARWANDAVLPAEPPADDAPLSGFADAISTLQQGTRSELVEDRSAGVRHDPSTGSGPELPVARSELVEDRSAGVRHGPSTGSGPELPVARSERGEDRSSGSGHELPVTRSELVEDHSAGVRHDPSTGSGHELPVARSELVEDHWTGSGPELPVARSELVEDHSTGVRHDPSPGSGHDHSTGSGHDRSTGAGHGAPGHEVALIGTRGLRSQVQALSSATPAAPPVQRVRYVDVTSRAGTQTGGTQPGASVQRTRTAVPVPSQREVVSRRSVAVERVAARSADSPPVPPVPPRPSGPAERLSVARSGGEALDDVRFPPAPPPPAVSGPNPSGSAPAEADDRPHVQTLLSESDGDPSLGSEPAGLDVVRPEPTPTGETQPLPTPVPAPMAIVQRRRAEPGHGDVASGGVSFSTMFSDTAAAEPASEGYTTVDLTTAASSPSRHQEAEIQRLSLPTMPSLPNPAVPQLPDAASSVLDRAGAASEAVQGAAGAASEAVQEAAGTGLAAARSAAGAVSGAAGAAGAALGGGDLDEMARRLFEPLSARLRAELWLDRERAGMVTDVRP